MDDAKPAELRKLVAQNAKLVYDAIETGMGVNPRMKGSSTR
jgi:hypothetical protein